MGAQAPITYLKKGVAMETLRKIIDMILVMLKTSIAQDYITSIIWAFVLAMVAFLLIKLWRGVLAWKPY